MPFIFAIMTARLTLDKAGRVVIPKRLRDKLRLTPGDAFQLESTEEEIVLRPVREAAPLLKERGVWVYRTGKPLSAETTDSLLRAIREERDDHHAGKG
jgi:AbrB family looped-hinge helix DNA binding protein